MHILTQSAVPSVASVGRLCRATRVAACYNGSVGGRER